MIKSFLPSATVFTSNGERIIQAIKCIEHRELGDWYIDLVAPLEYQSYLEKDYILVVPTKEKGDQPFRINNPKITDKVDVRAYHIGFDTKNYAVELSTVVNGNAQACLDELTTNIDGTHPFTFTSAITTLKTFSVVDTSLYNALVQIAEEYNGILDFDEWGVNITSSIGADNGVILAYGKNIQESEINENWDLVVTRLKPIGNNGITLTPAWLDADVSYDRPYTKIMNFDTDEIADLELVAQLYLDRYKVPRVNYKVKADVEQNVALGDAVTVNARQFTTTAEVLSFDYNPLINRVIQVEFGNFRPTLKTFFSDMTAETEEKAVKRAQLKIDETNGEIEAIADELTIQIGQRVPINTHNYVLNSDFASDLANWTNNGTGTGTRTIQTIGDKKYLRIDTTTTTNSFYGVTQLIEPYQHGEEITYSIVCRRNSGDGRLRFRVESLGDGNQSPIIDNYITPTSAFARYSFTFTSSSVAEKTQYKLFLVMETNKQAQIEMSEVMLEVGSEASDYILNPAEIPNTKYVFTKEGANFYADAFKLYSALNELKVYFDLVKDALNLGININMPIYEPTGITELATILNGGRKGFQFGEPSGSDYLAYITAVNMKTIAGLTEDEIRLRIRSSERLELYGDDGVRVEGLLDVVDGFDPRYDDIVFEMTPTRINPNTSKPDYDYTNIGFLFPQNVTTEIINITVQLPHKWKEGTTIYPHVHVRQAANQQAVFKLDYIWYNAGDTIPTTWATYTMNEYAVTPYVSGTIANIVKGADGIDGTGKEISSILKLKLYRDDNVYTGDMLVDQFDIHIEVDSLGSQEEYTK
jgi:phage minor structural protein